jgi:hypothetical protein
MGTRRAATFRVDDLRVIGCQIAFLNVRILGAIVKTADAALPPTLMRRGYRTPRPRFSQRYR